MIPAPPRRRTTAPGPGGYLARVINTADSGFRPTRLVAVTAIAVALFAAGCSSSSASKGSGGSTSTTAGKAAVSIPAGPKAELTAITAGGTPFMGSATTSDLKAEGYTEQEYVASGTASSYQAQGTPGADGKWTFTPDTSAPYKTRVLVRRPSDAKKFSGNVVVEWLNVSGGLDADPDWASLHEEIIRHGDAWVGVSAQLIGVEGGPVLVSVPVGADLLGKGLKKIDPARYGTLSHPGDGYSFDMFTQVARTARAGGAPLGNVKVQHVIAAGESQSAFALVTYVNGVQPITRAFDGFFVHSRGAVGLGLVGPGQSADIAGSIGGTASIFRTDTTVPIIDVQAETDVGGILRSAAARQPDSSTFRLWEVPGTAHADRHLMGTVADSLDCGAPINDGPLHVVTKAAFHALEAWVDNGTLPRQAPRLTTTGADNSQISRDSDGIALGGVRTPPVDVPVEVLSGVPGPNQSTICLLLGSTQPLPADRLAALYPNRAAYQAKFGKALATAIAQGYVLPADRAAMQAYAHPEKVTG